MKWRVFTNDVGPNAYSALGEISAPSLREAKAEAKRRCSGLIMDNAGLKILVLPDERKALFPDGQTGKIKREARAFIVGAM
jgi:hypothetical protein